MTDRIRRIFPVLLSGGSGSRLWPLSREDNPKQLLRLNGERTLLQETALRVLDPQLFEPLTVIGRAEHRFLIAEQLREIGAVSPTIVLEPFPRNTAPASAVAALVAARIHPDALVLLMPTDHWIAEVAAFHAAVALAAEAAYSGFLSLFGITPEYPATGYGYIEVGNPLSGMGSARRVRAFTEKPDRVLAERYIESGGHLWNSGIFLLPASSFLSELSRLEPDILSHAREALERSSRDLDFLRLDAGAFERCHSTSIDSAVMERTDRAAVIPVDFAWTDVGCWSALSKMAGRNEDGNATIGKVLTESTTNSYIRSDGPLVATIGVEDLIIVATEDAVLVVHKDHDQDIRKIVERLRAGNHGRV